MPTVPRVFEYGGAGFRFEFNTVFLSEKGGNPTVFFGSGKGGYAGSGSGYQFVSFLLLRAAFGSGSGSVLTQTLNPKPLWVDCLHAGASVGLCKSIQALRG